MQMFLWIKSNQKQLREEQNYENVKNTLNLCEVEDEDEIIKSQGIINRANLS